MNSHVQKAQVLLMWSDSQGFLFLYIYAFETKTVYNFLALGHDRIMSLVCEV